MNAQQCFANEDEATNWALDWLGARGFLISKPVLGEMLSPATLRRRHAPHLDASGFHRRLQHRHCPPFLHVRAKGGRLVELCPTPALIAWLARPAEPGKRAEPFSVIAQPEQSGPLGTRADYEADVLAAEKAYESNKSSMNHEDLLAARAALRRHFPPST